MRQGHKWENEVFFFLNYLFKGLVNLKYYNEKNSITYLELGYDIGIVIAVLEGDLVLIVKALKLKFSDPDRSLNRKRERFKVFEVEPRSNRGQTVMMS